MLQVLSVEVGTFQSASLCIGLWQTVIDSGHAWTLTDVMVQSKVIADGTGGKSLQLPMEKSKLLTICF